MESGRQGSLRWRHSCLLLLVGLLQLAAGSAVPSYVIDHAPIIWMHSDDPFMPSDIASHVSHTRPYLGFDPVPNAPALDLNSLSSLNQFGKDDGKDVFLTSIDNVTTRPDWLLGETPDAEGALHNSTACAVVIVERSARDVDAFYFYFYSFDEAADITQVLPPFNRIFPDSKPGDHFGNHVGDWEHNMIRFKDGAPTGIWYSQHSFGEACLWDDEACFSKRGDRPIVYSARGSHANYPSTGHHVHDEALVDIADRGRVWDPVKPAYFYHYDPTADTFAAADGDHPTDWLYFNGAWGDKQYADSDPRQETVPYFGLKRYNNGPNGPRFKHLVRKGLAPDERPPANLMKTLVHLYLSMYGCCLQGINPWVVVILALLGLAVVTFLLVFTFRRLVPYLRRSVFGDRRRRRQPQQERVGAGGFARRLKGWFARGWRRRPEREKPAEFTLGLLDPEHAEDDV